MLLRDSLGSTEKPSSAEGSSLPTMPKGVAATRHSVASEQTRSDCVDLDWVWEWFHTHSPDVEPDKSRKFRYKRKRAKVAGKVRDLTCELRILTRKRHEAIDTFLASPEYSAFEKSTGQSLHPKTVGKCICPCMKSDKRNDCACPICTAMHHRLDAWNKQRPDWHKGGQCSCSLDCQNTESKFRQMSRGFGLFMDAITCPRRPHPGLEMPHAPAEPPNFRPLRCCCQPKSRGRHQPDHVTLCTECGWDNVVSGRFYCKNGQTPQGGSLVWTPV